MNPNVASGKAWRCKNPKSECVVQIMHLYRMEYGKLTARVIDLSTKRIKNILVEDLERDYKYLSYDGLLQSLAIRLSSSS
ncbi:hypothetical protein [Vibrio phage vB_VpaP_SJSY21]|nr:hypothetical protein [Vibrio phage vB_VpaP_SJSY21]